MSKKRQFQRQQKVRDKFKKAAPNEAVWLSKRDLDVIQKKMINEIGVDAIAKVMSVSYTHLTLPTTSRV